MPDNKTMELYRSRRLPKDLRPEILERHRAGMLRAQRNRRILRPAAALASIALCISLGAALLLRPADTLTVSGRQIGTRPAAVETCAAAYESGIALLTLPGGATEPLRTAQACISIPVDRDGGVCISVSGGMLLLPGTGGHPVFAGQSGWAEDASDILWALDGCESASPLSAEIFDRDGTPLKRLQLTYDSARGAWMASLEKP